MEIVRISSNKAKAGCVIRDSSNLAKETLGSNVSRKASGATPAIRAVACGATSVTSGIPVHLKANINARRLSSLGRL